MSMKWPGGLIRKTPVTPAGPLQNGAAPGMWTLGEAAYWTKQGLWPIAGNFLAVEDVFSTYLYSGNATSQTISNGLNLSANGGLVWFKNRSLGATEHILATKETGRYYSSSNTGIVGASSALSFQWNTSGYGFTNSSDSLNASGSNYASWAFREAPKFFDIVTWTGDGTNNRSIAHNLGIAPGCIIARPADAAGDWYVYHRGTDPTAAYAWYLLLNSTAARAGAPAVWDVAPTATNFTVQSGTTNINGTNYVAYLFAHDTSSDGIIQCGSYTGNGSATGPIVTLGWEPQWLLIKSASTATDWWLVDNMRGFTFDAVNGGLQANSSNAESSLSAPGQVRPLPTGFQLNNTGSGFNNSGTTYIYIAIRRGPMRTPTLGTTVFAPVASSAAVTTQITTGFPVDLHLAAYRPGDSYNFNFTDRLRGMMQTASQPTQRVIISSSTGAEQAASTSVGYEFWNTGWRIGGYYNTASTIYYDFRRAPSFFDEVCYTGTGSALTVNHNLGVVPELMIIKSRSATSQWIVYAQPQGISKYLLLSSNAAVQDDSSGQIWNFGTAPTASVFTVGTAQSGSSTTYVAYLFASCPGVSKVGSYTGTGALQTINCGFTTGARFVLIKRTDSTGDWFVWDSARGISSGNDPYLLLNSTAAEVTGTNYVDTDTTGFKVTAAAPAGINASGGSYIFLAIA